MTLRPAIPLYQHRGSVIHTAPGTEPIAAADLRTHLRVDATELPDGEANSLIAEARQMLEDQFGIAFISQSWRLTLDRWPAASEAWWDGVRQSHINEIYGGNASLEIPRWPLASVTSCTVYDEASNSSAVTVATTFDVDIYSTPGRMTLKRGATWPVALRANNAIEIVYVAGYANAAAVPATLKRAVKQLAAFLYTNRGDSCSPADALDKSGANQIMAIYQPARV